MHATIVMGGYFLPLFSNSLMAEYTEHRAPAESKLHIYFYCFLTFWEGQAVNILSWALRVLPQVTHSSDG